ncbi:MAG: argininosuccinate lyase [Endomicrobiaceae bacterium]|nr:argininosuccinate lyase [Endomicrobiaceae bacterium]MDD3922372.1 argininosuccinate lyase [Endomicrobiaceae bacterium]
MKNFEQFIGSFSFDNRLAEVDIIGSVAHTQMLVKTKIISSSDGKKIIAGLKSILRDLQKGWQLPQEEDIHFAVEKELIKRIGPVGGKMHTARSRNDQVATDLRLYVREEIYKIIEMINSFQTVIVKKAEESIDIIMPGYTHLQPAQPIIGSHHLLAYAWMLERDKQRLFDCLKRTNIMPLGSAALAGTSFKIDRKYTAKILEFDFISDNSLDAVSDRDFAGEYIFDLSMIAMHLSKLSEEIIIWSSVEFNFIKIDDKFTSGSSIMPQKRNPDCAEIIRGKSGRVFGDLMAMLTIMKALPIAYNRDLQEDKPPVFDATDTVKLCLGVITELMQTFSFKKDTTLKSTEKGFLQATEVADYLAKKNIPFRTAHGIVKNIVNYCIKNEKTLDSLSLNEYKIFSEIIDKDIYSFIDVKNIVNAKVSIGGTSKKSVVKQILDLKKLIKGKR